MQKIEQNGNSSVANNPTTTTNFETSSEHRNHDASGGASAHTQWYFSQFSIKVVEDFSLESAVLIDIVVQMHNWQKAKYFECSNQMIQKRTKWSRNKIGRELDALKSYGLIDYDFKVFGTRRIHLLPKIYKYYTLNTGNGRLEIKKQTTDDSSLFDSVLYDCMHQNGALTNDMQTRGESKTNAILLDNSNLEDAMHQNGAREIFAESIQAQKSNATLLDDNSLEDAMHQNGALHNGQCSQNYEPCTKMEHTVHQNGASIIIIKEKKKEYNVQNQVLDGVCDFSKNSVSQPTGDTSHQGQNNNNAQHQNPTPNPLPKFAVPGDCAAPLSAFLTDADVKRINSRLANNIGTLRNTSSAFVLFYCLYGAMVNRICNDVARLKEAYSTNIEQPGHEQQFVQSFIHQLCTKATNPDQKMLEYVEAFKPESNQTAPPQPKSSGSGREKAPKRKSLNPDDDAMFMQFWNAYGNKQGKQPSFQSWRKLTESEKQQCIASVDGYTQYLANLDWKREKMLPTTYINQKQWESDWASLTEQAKPKQKPKPKPTYGKDF